MTIIRNHARQYFKKMAKMGVTIDVEVKPKLLVEKEKKRKVEVDKPMQALLEVYIIPFLLQHHVLMISPGCAPSNHSKRVSSRGGGRRN